MGQYALTPAAYEYWKIIEEQSKQSGELYESQPATNTGNIHSTDDPQEPVIGLFYATSVQGKSIFISPRIPPATTPCLPYGLSTGELNSLLSNIQPRQYPVWLLVVGYTEMGNLIFDYVNQECFDCRLKGGSTIKPDFWE